jgi:hypothetical protein
VLAWIVVAVVVALPVVGTIVWIAKGSADKRGLEQLVRERGWSSFRGAPGRAPRPGNSPGPLRRLDEKVEQGVTGTHRGRPFALYRYGRSTGGFNADGTRQTGAHRTVVHIEVATPLPKWVLTIGSAQVTCPEGVTLRPEVEEWLTSGGHRQLYVADRTIAVEVKGIPSGKRLLATLDFLNGVADRLPLAEAR